MPIGTYQVVNAEETRRRLEGLARACDDGDKDLTLSACDLNSNVRDTFGRVDLRSRDGKVGAYRMDRDLRNTYAALLSASPDTIKEDKVKVNLNSIIADLDAARQDVIRDSLAKVARVNVMDRNGKRWLGSGYFYKKTEGGYFMVTNKHVADDAKDISIVVRDPSDPANPDKEQTLEAEVVGIDQMHDVAVIKIKTDKEFPLAEFGDSSTLKHGREVVVIGAPSGFNWAATLGIVSNPSANTLQWSPTRDIHTDASIDGGNSGGMMIDTATGHVMGMPTYGFGNLKTAFALPSNTVKSVADDLIAGRRREHGMLAMRLDSLSEMERELLNNYSIDWGNNPESDLRFGMKISTKDAGQFVNDEDGSGFQDGDILVDADIDGEKFTFDGYGDPNGQLQRWISEKKIGSQVNLTVMRPKHNVDRDGGVVLVDPQYRVTTFTGKVSPYKETKTYVDQSLGITVEKQPDGLLLVTHVAPNSPAARANLPEGKYQILKIGGNDVRSAEDAKQVLEAFHAIVQPNGKNLTLVLAPLDDTSKMGIITLNM